MGHTSGFTVTSPPQGGAVTVRPHPSLMVRAGARRARASLVSDVGKRRQTVSDYTAGRYLVMSRKAEEIGGHD